MKKCKLIFILMVIQQSFLILCLKTKAPYFENKNHPLM